MNDSYIYIYIYIKKGGRRCERHLEPRSSTCACNYIQPQPEKQPNEFHIQAPQPIYPTHRITSAMQRIYGTRRGKIGTWSRPQAQDEGSLASPPKKAMDHSLVVRPRLGIRLCRISCKPQYQYTELPWQARVTLCVTFRKRSHCLPARRNQLFDLMPRGK